MRELIDPVSPEALRPVFQGVFRQLQRGKALEPMMFLNGAYLLALDGTGYFSSQTMHCQSCLHKVHRNGSITSYHQMLGAAIIHPDMREVMPFMPEPMVKQDGTAKNDGERNAAKRFLVKLRQDHPPTASALSPQTASVRMLPTSRRCTRTLCPTSWVSKQRSMPLGSSMSS